MADNPMMRLYKECLARGLNVRGLSGWSTWQSGYYFYRDGWSTGNWMSVPQAFINHHTATSEYTPNVKNSKGQSKANIWLGLSRSGTSRYYSTGSGTPQASFAVASAANYGNGACNKAVYNNYVLRDRVAPNQPSDGDNGYANRMAVGMEIVHRGDGSILDPGVWELAAQINAAAMDVFGWPIARILDHRSSTFRKVDINFKQKEGGYSINALRTRIVEIGSGTTPPVPEPEEDDVFLPVNEGDGIGGKAVKRSDVSVVQRLLNAHPAVTPKIATDGKYGSATVAAVRQVAPDTHTQSGKSVGGQTYYSLQEVAFGGDGGGSTPHNHTFNGITSTAG